MSVCENWYVFKQIGMSNQQVPLINYKGSSFRYFRDFLFEKPNFFFVEKRDNR